MRIIALIAASAAALALAACQPAEAAENAGFTGVRTEVHATVSDFSRIPNLNDVGYNAVIGVDAPLGNRFTAGAEVEAKNVFDSNGRAYGVGARLGYAATENVLVFGRVGYDRLEALNTRTLDGSSYGVGAEWRISERTHLTGQYRHTNYEQGADANTVSVGIGYRF